MFSVNFSVKQNIKCFLLSPLMALLILRLTAMKNQQLTMNTFLYHIQGSWKIWGHLWQRENCWTSWHGSCLPWCQYTNPGEETWTRHLSDRQVMNCSFLVHTQPIEGHIWMNYVNIQITAIWKYKELRKIQLNSDTTFLNRHCSVLFAVSV